MSKKMLLRTCKSCNRRFFSEGEKQFYDEHGLKYPKLCKSCRELRKKAQEIAKSISDFYEQPELSYVKLQDFCIDEPEHTLIVIGNGFDKMHGVPSGYYDFRDSMRSRNELRENLEFLIDSDDLWGNFEENLARLNDSIFYEMLDSELQLYGSYESYKRDGSIADIMAPAEMLMEPVDVIVSRLPKEFRRWVNSLPAKPAMTEISNILKPGLRYLNFNYTEFLESLYGVPHEKITYIHGCRKNAKDILVIGHAEDDDYLAPEPKGIPSYKDPDMRGVFEEASLQIGNHMNWYEDAMTKHTKQIIKEHKDFFECQTDVRAVVTLGHSLSGVDWPYFKELIKSSGLDNVKWKISFYSDDDLQRIYFFCKEMNIRSDHITLIDLS